MKSKKDFDGWNIKKKNIEYNIRPHFKNGDVFYEKRKEIIDVVTW